MGLAVGKSSPRLPSTCGRWTNNCACRYPQEKLTRVQALKGATLDAAYASFSEASFGSLQPGKKADFVVLDRDIVDEATPASEILKTVVLATVIDGQFAYGSL